MTYQIFYEDLHPEDVEHARAYVQDYLDATYAPDRTLAVARVLHALLPAPPRPTLADMTPEERAECRWMQADTEARGRAIITVTEWMDGNAELLDRQGNSFYAAHSSVTPRPDLPRFVWPGDTPAPAVPALPEGWRLADHPHYGRVFVTSPEPDFDGDLWFIDPGAAPGVMEGWCDTDVLTFLDTPDAVPPNTLAVGSEWDDADALARACEESGRDQIVVSDSTGDVFVWAFDAEWWEDTVPPRLSPYTIIHIGKKADQ